MLLLALSRFRQALFLSLATLILVGCGPGGGSGDGSGSDPGDVAPDVLRIGSGSGANFVGGELNASQTSLAAGESTSIQVNVVNQNGNPPASSSSVSFSSICVSSGLASFENLLEITTGLSQITYIPEGCTGDDIITATLAETGGTASVTIAIAPPEVLNVTFVSSEFPRLSLQGVGGGQKSTELTFRVTGPQSIPIIGDRVSFNVNNEIGTLLAGREFGVTDNEGLVRTILESSNEAGNVSVIATHDATGISGSSDDIPLSSGVPSASRFSLSYSIFNPADAFNTDGIEVSFNVIVADQFGNEPSDGTEISFVSPETGLIQPSCKLVSGRCSVTWVSSSGSDSTPVDNRVIIIAFTDGAEAFNDSNGDGIFNTNISLGTSETFTDLAEPFADKDGDGVFNAGLDYFFDTNGDGFRNPGNGEWDGPCLFDNDNAAICHTGSSTTITISQTATIVMSDNSAELFNVGDFGPDGTTINLIEGEAGVSFGGLFLQDGNTFADNPLPFGTVVEFVAEGDGISLQGNTRYVIENAISPTGPYGVTVVADAVEPPDVVSNNARLTLKITTPGGTSPPPFSWPVNIANGP